MRIVVSLSTIPSRVEKLNIIVDNMLRQTLQPDSIIINLPFHSIREKRPYPIFSSSCPLVKVNRCKDYGPLTKLYPTLQVEKDENTLIVTVDDDVNYPLDLLEQLYKAYKRNRECAIGASGYTVGKWWNLFGRVNKPLVDTKTSVIEGYSGCLYKRGFFKDDLLDYGDAPKTMFYHDDLWISGYLAKRGIPRYVMTNSIEHSNNSNGSNGLSDNKLMFIFKMIPAFAYFNGVFPEEHIVPIQDTIGFWITLIIVLLILMMFAITIQYKTLR